MTKLACTIAAVAALASAGAASAQTVRAAYGDLDLSSPRDARAFTGRVDLAAQEACAGPFHGDLRSFTEHPRCVALVRDELIGALPAAHRKAYSAAARAGAAPYVRAANGAGARAGI